MRLILVRHGHTDDLKHKIMQSDRPTPLNRRGREQAKLVAKALKKLKINRFYSSDIVRAKQTAEYIAKYQPDLEINYSPLVREKSAGIYAGWTHEQIIHKLKKNYFSHWHRPTKGESWHDVFLRGMRALRYFQKRHPRSTILIVSHGGFIRLLLTHIFHGRNPKFRPEYHHDNTGVTIIEWRNKKPKIVQLNDISHLKKSLHSH
jgi:broad specificity phosphatase PhoE